VIDLHAHLLPGLDDGAQTLEDSRAIGRAAVAEGVEAIAATPHVRHDYPTTAEQMEAGVSALRADFEREGISVQVLHGGEIDLEILAGFDHETLARFTYAQTGRYLLLEFPYTGWPLGLDQRVFALRAAGITPVLAHPERNGEVQSVPERLEDLVRLGAVIQVTAASLDGRLGKSSRDAGLRLLELGLVDVLASDAHTPSVREAGLAAAVEALGDEGLARHLTENAPRAIVAGDELPRCPPYRRPRRRRLLF
jgi:protein-tyrosine phosphatase